jgi:RNA polymerase sigma-70 factor (ECF subfamily)
MTSTDAELVSRARAGDLACYVELLQRHRASLERYAVRVLGNREDAEEALQDSLIRAWEALGRGHQPESVRSWLFRILVNRCRTRLSRPDRMDRGPGAEVALSLAASVSQTDGEAWREEISRALARLPTDQREAFLLKHVEEFSYEEIGELTGSSIPALKMRVNRACLRLRALLEDVYRA